MILKIQLFNPFPQIDTVEIYRYAKHGSEYMHYPIKINGVEMSIRKLNNAVFVKGDIAPDILPEMLALLVRAINVHPNMEGKNLFH